MSFIENVKSKVKNDIKTIVLPESNDIRVLKATQQILKEEFADIILIGNREQINKLAKENNLDISKAKIVDPKTSNKFSSYASTLFYYPTLEALAEPTKNESCETACRMAEG